MDMHNDLLPNTTLSTTTSCSKSNQLSDVLDLFEDTLNPTDMLTAKIIAQISTAITNERLKLHMTQAQFARHIGASQSLVSRWERGDYNFSIRKIAEIAAALNLDVQFSFCNIIKHHHTTDKDYKNYPPTWVSEQEGTYHR